ncbi:prepilin-type N-terminal cleavage/methylation domain-containing protein [Verminephrobacter eiseniae]|uniref:prepilin-type N-terminal cleavage/methylation domain-containing protein n=1 Tax=Verminephrobacter eiseniae TaxID=364317 RepID=UPI0022388B1E|nr:prepilin-type N-terminal cleavage/methylation domain-containing protein [Verminephrobacter eiseniae]MCW5237777.1 type II secretion system protein GspH [Verminephrobacter eiseniae]
MPAHGPGSHALPRWRGFTLLELLIVICIMALATAGVGLALRDDGQMLLEREAARLAALLESARAQSRAAGVPVRWRVLPQGARSGGLRQDFRFEGLRPGAQAALPSQWLDAGTVVHGQTVLQLGPEPLIGPQQVQIGHPSYPGRRLRVATDGVRPFAVESVP